jgi:hypothetical protein
MATIPIKVPPPMVRSPHKSYGITETKTTTAFNNAVSNICTEQALDVTVKQIALSLLIWDVLCSDLGVKVNQPA